MAVPKFYEFFGSFLRCLSDSKTHSAKEVRKFIADDMNLTDEDKAEMLPSGKQTSFSNRVNWA
ncbi:MAG: winged helix-turn-helix domain-containing protein, partial [Oscillospiraceae bacterium]|nr:winged helix-turn-helix domain-containing protein [Oscillospiraceae bacterium]